MTTQDYSVPAQVQTAATDSAAAQSSFAAAVAAINPALVSLANGTAFSLAEDPPGSFALSEQADQGGYAVQGALSVAASDMGTAQSLAQAAVAAIATAISGLSPAVTVTYEKGSEGGGVGFLFTQEG